MLLSPSLLPSFFLGGGGGGGGGAGGVEVESCLTDISPDLIGFLNLLSSKQDLVFSSVLSIHATIQCAH
jgi:hypothetical protein